jgi:hypothetical protein
LSEGEHQAVGEPTGVALELGEVAVPVVALNSYRGTAALLVNRSIHEVEAPLALVQAHLEVQVACAWEVLGSPLDVEYPVGCCTRNRGEYAVARVDRVEVVPVGEDGVAGRGVGQAAVGEGGVSVAEVELAI